MSVGETQDASASAVAKTASGIPIRNLWHMLLYAWGEARFQSHWQADVESAPSLDALYAIVLQRLIRQRLRIGLGRDYRVDDSLISGIRGRIKFTDSLKRLSFLQGKAYCTFQSFNPNVAKNQIVRSVLAQLVQTGKFGAENSYAKDLRHELRRTVRDLDFVDLVELNPDLIRRQLLKRHDADYRLMLAVCSLVVQSQMPTEVSGKRSLPQLDRDGMILWKVYESFVARFYSMKLKGWLVKAQPSFHWNEPNEPSVFLPVLKPDLVLRHRTSNEIVVLDTKFTPNLLVQGQWGKQTINRNHLFQMYAYLRSQELESSDHRQATGVLLYPTVDCISPLEAVLDGHRILWATVDLSRPWSEVEAALIAMVQGTRHGPSVRLLAEI